MHFWQSQHLKSFEFSVEYISRFSIDIHTYDTSKSFEYFDNKPKCWTFLYSLLTRLRNPRVNTKMKMIFWLKHDVIHIEIACSKQDFMFSLHIFWKFLFGFFNHLLVYFKSQTQNFVWKINNDLKLFWLNEARVQNDICIMSIKYTTNRAQIIRTKFNDSIQCVLRNFSKKKIHHMKALLLENLQDFDSISYILMEDKRDKNISEMLERLLTLEK